MDLDSKFEKLIKNQIKYKSSSLALNLLISRLQRKYSANPSPAQLNDCLQEMKAFFEKYISIMQKDIEALKKL
ncbi:MAG: hypothetical protein WBI74_12590 [Caldicoprobacterales bacterium]